MAMAKTERRYDPELYERLKLSGYSEEFSQSIANVIVDYYSYRGIVARRPSFTGWFIPTGDHKEDFIVGRIPDGAVGG